MSVFIYWIWWSPDYDQNTSRPTRQSVLQIIFWTPIAKRWTAFFLCLIFIPTLKNLSFIWCLMILCCKQDESKFSNCTEFYDFLLNSDAAASAEVGVEVESSRQTLQLFPSSFDWIYCNHEWMSEEFLYCI